MHVVLLSSDLMIGARLEGAVRQHSLTLVTVSSQDTAIEAVRSDCALIVVDLRLVGLDVASLVQSVRAASDDHVPIVACGPHVHEAKLAAAREAGCELVVTRGQLDREAESIVGQLLKR